MSRKTILYIWAVAAFFVAILHPIAIHYYLYWLLPWVDLFVHGLGGLVVFTPFFLYFRDRLSPLAAFAASLGGLLLVDIGWEAFEYLQGLTSIEPGFFSDTAGDTIASFIGAFLMFSLISLGNRSEV